MYFLAFFLGCPAFTAFRLLDPEALDPVGDCASEDDAVVVFRDDDGDGQGVDGDVRLGCLPAEGWAGESGDCDDDDPDVFLGHPDLLSARAFVPRANSVLPRVARPSGKLRAKAQSRKDGRGTARRTSTFYARPSRRSDPEGSAQPSVHFLCGFAALRALSWAAAAAP